MDLNIKVAGLVKKDIILVMFKTHKWHLKIAGSKKMIHAANPKHSGINIVVLCLEACV